MTGGPDADVTNDGQKSEGFHGLGMSLDLKADVPFGSAAYRAFDHVRKAGDTEDQSEWWNELNAVGEAVADIGLNVMACAADPMNFLITAGLSFLVTLIDPLNDALGLVTGNPKKIGDDIAQWNRVATALGPLAEEIRTVAWQNMAGWKGLAGTEAKQRVNEFADGVVEVAEDVRMLAAGMAVAKALMEVAQAFILGLIATFVEWLVFTWLAAIATAPVTAGASTATAAAATESRFIQVLERIVRFLERFVKLFKKLESLVGKLNGPGKMRSVRAAFRVRGANGQFLSGVYSPARPVANYVVDPLTWVPPAVKAAKTVSEQVADNGVGGVSGEDTDRRLGREP